MDPAYGQRYRDLYLRHWWWRARERLVLDLLDRMRPPGGWRHALDVGCGDGLFFPVLRDYAATVEGVEPDAALVSRTARDDGTIHVRPFDASFASGYPFDLVFFLDVLEHLDDAEGAVAHAAALMEPTGTLVVTVPAFLHLWTTHDDVNHHRTRYTRTRLTALLAPHFVLDTVRYFFRWVHPVKAVQHMVESLVHPHPTPAGIPPAPLNAVLYALSRVEESVLGGVGVPLGSSLLAVGRKRG